MGPAFCKQQHGVHRVGPPAMGKGPIVPPVPSAEAAGRKVLRKPLLCPQDRLHPAGLAAHICTR